MSVINCSCVAPRPGTWPVTRPSRMATDAVGLPATRRKSPRCLPLPFRSAGCEPRPWHDIDAACRLIDDQYIGRSASRIRATRLSVVAAGEIAHQLFGRGHADVELAGKFFDQRRLLAGADERPPTADAVVRCHGKIGADGRPRNSACCLWFSGTRPMPWDRGRDWRSSPTRDQHRASSGSAPKMARRIRCGAHHKPGKTEDLALVHLERHIMQFDGAGVGGLALGG